jgi:hypothetical protein
MAANVAETTKLLDSIHPESFQSETDRYEAKEAAKRLLARLETPFERGWALGSEASVLAPGLIVFRDLGIWSRWNKLSKSHGPVPQSLDQIINMCNAPAEPNLLREFCPAGRGRGGFPHISHIHPTVEMNSNGVTPGRFLRHFAALYVLEETAVDEWKPTPFSLAMGDDSTYTNETVRSGFTHCNPCGVNLPSFLAKHQYREPLDTRKGDNHTETFGCAFFDYLRENNTAGSSFRGAMTAMGNHKMNWTEVYDTTGLIEGADFSGTAPPLFVDIGGGGGLDAARLLSRHPNLPGAAELVIQDLPEVSEVYGTRDSQGQQQLDRRIRRMPHDFFTPQPLKGARAYFFHAVPHDWPDEECVKILRHVRAAMKKGYSKLLIYEIVLPPRGATSVMTTLDLQLMNVLCGLERTEAHWARLLEAGGLRVVKIWRHPTAIESIIEAELP